MAWIRGSLMKAFPSPAPLQSLNAKANLHLLLGPISMQTAYDVTHGVLSMWRIHKTSSFFFSICFFLKWILRFSSMTYFFFVCPVRCCLSSLFKRSPFLSGYRRTDFSRPSWYSVGHGKFIRDKQKYPEHLVLC